jgi:uncharacterized protein YndB with AHSA1/START domain
MEKQIVVSRIFNAPVKMVWKIWTDPELVMRWWGPDRFSCPSAKMDFREGGTSIVCMRSPKEMGENDMYSIWNYTRIVPLQSIEFIQNLADREGNKMSPLKLGMPVDFPVDIRTVVIFKDLGKDKTEMTVTEYADMGSMTKFAKLGLEQCFDKMVAIFTNP